jgi:uncharacterized phage-like protein YoqJ
VIICGTGHRPKQIQESFGEVRVKARVKLQYTKGVDTFVCGMADGFDLIAADAAMELGLEIWAARPWTGHKVGSDWSELYQRVLEYATKTVVVTEADTYPGHWCMHKRNEWMVDNSDAVMAYLRPDVTSGGTFACRNYAKKTGAPVANIYDNPPF